MWKHVHPGDRHSDSQSRSQSAAGHTGRMSRSLDTSKPRKLFRRFPLNQGVDISKDDATITNNKDSKTTPEEPEAQDRLERDKSVSVVREEDVTTNPVDRLTQPNDVEEVIKEESKLDTIPIIAGDASEAASHPNPSELEQAISHAENQNSTTKPILGSAKIAVDMGTEGNSGLQSIDNFDATYLQPFKISNTVVKEIANVHPYAKIALGGLSSASEMILNQANRDEAILKLLPKLRDIYELLIKDGELDRISGMREVLGPMSNQILECAQFIDKYSETKGFWTRLGKNVLSETDETIEKYNDALDEFMQKFRDHAARDTVVKVHRIVEDLDRLGQDIRLDGMQYARGAGFNTTKTCLEGTRLEILGEITDWINDDSSERIFWLSGVAGSGKSTISHTIGQWLRKIGQLGSFFCFDRNEGDHRY